MNKERVIENLRQSLYKLMKNNPSVILLGEDIAGPYGGAFNATKGFSDEMEDRVIATPISEESFVNMASGMAIMGLNPIIDMMFSDFSTLAFDAILNFMTKSVSMYGKTIDMNVILRCANGGYRGYGATHSQSMQKYFMGIPNLRIYELSPFHNNLDVLNRMLNEKVPCMYFEEKILYSKYMFQGGVIKDLFKYKYCGTDNNWAVVSTIDGDIPDIAMICPGGMAYQCIDVAEKLLLEEEVEAKVYVPSRLYPCNVEEIIDELSQCSYIVIIEESTEGNTWGAEVATKLYPLLWEKLEAPIKLVSSKDSIIPANIGYEKEILVSENQIYNTIIHQLINKNAKGDSI